MSATILIIDDDEFLCDTISGYLEEQDYSCLTAQDGPAGLELFRREKIDLVLLDIRMPEMSGIQVLEIMIAESPEMPVVVISSTGKMSDVVQVLQLGAWDYVSKPIDEMELLLHHVVKALDRSRLLKENVHHREILSDLVKCRTSQLETTSSALQQANTSLSSKDTALNEILGSIEDQKKNLVADIGRQIDEVTLPMLLRLKQKLSGSELRLADQLESSLKEVSTSYRNQASVALGELSPTERRLCHLIHKGLAVKEIASLENVSPETVSTHRRSIRRKLGLTNKKANLAAHLDTLLCRAE